MSKKFRGKPCVYCGGLAESADHVIAREFILPEQRANLPKVPACQKCNSAKSKLEHYLTGILPLGARTPAAAQIALRTIPKRHAKNPWLREALANAQPRPGGLAVPIQAGPLEELCGLIARALLWHRFGVILPTGYSSTATVFQDTGRQEFARIAARFPSDGWVFGEFGDGGFKFIGARATNDPCCSLWAFEFYGGALLAEGGLRAGSLIVAVTGRMKFIEELSAKLVARPAPAPPIA
jgi:hypothetical protein